MSRRVKKQRVGFIDLCRVDSNGDVHCNDSAKVKRNFGVDRYLPIDKDHKECVDWDPSVPLTKDGHPPKKACRRWQKTRYSREIVGTPGPRTRKVGGAWGSKQGAPFFSSTSKVHAPAFGIPPAGSCPAVQTPVLNWLKDAVKDPKLQKPQAMINRLLDEVPRKCLACYATSGNYAYAETQDAMANRMEWFNKTPDKQVVEQLVYAIKHAGNEQCKPGKGCKFTPGVQPEYFRAFDSGDFQSVRDVRIWTEVVRRLPETKFWFPTTAYGGLCHSTPKKTKEFLKALRTLNAHRNAVVRPSSRGLDRPAIKIKGLGPGSAVIERTVAQKGSKSFYEQDEQVYQKPGRVSNRTMLCEKDGTSCTSHWVCPGNCALCRKCWNKTDPVVYRRHGLRPEVKNIQKMVKKVAGLEEHGGSSKRAVFDAANEKIQNAFGKVFNEMFDGPAPPPSRVAEGRQARYEKD
jgi:hypothetical protein